MHLSRIFLSPGNLNNAYEWHRSIWSLFPSESPGSLAPFLFHIERMNLATGASVLVQSVKSPQGRSAYASILATKQFNPFFHRGQQVRFLLQANPAKCITDSSDKPNKRNRGKCRVPIIKEEEQKDWFKRKLAEVAQIKSIDSRINPPLYFRKGSRAGKIIPVTFSGMLEVIESATMISLIENGIGPAKAFGCG
ncbi:MAG: type I-E CRISPR-associated protein Cas6/Cse3/CasE, partial [Candidatus Neomarinimicrobiota bacterium]